MAISKSLFRTEFRGLGHLVMLTLILGVLSFKGFSYQVADTVKNTSTDSIIFHKFDGSSYRASSYSYRAVEDEDGILFFWE